MFLLITASFWRFWLRNWAYLATFFVIAVYTLGIVTLKMQMSRSGIPHTVGGGWRSVTTQILIIFFTFPFIRLRISWLLAASTISSAALVYISFQDPIQALLAGTGLTIAILGGAAVWYNNYRRERNLFDRTLELERSARAAEESEALATDLAERHRKLARAITHDIRQPMAAVSIQMALLGQEGKAIASGNTPLAPLAYAFEALKSQVQEIARDVFPVGSEQLSGPSRVNIGDLLTNTALLHTPLAKVNNIEVRVWIGRSVAGWDGVSNLGNLTTVLQSLLSNSTKFRNANALRSFISVGARRVDDQILVTVIDNGIGIATEALESVFDEEFSIDRVSNDSAGLGLYNVKRIINALPGHSVKVASIVGRCTCFRINLPAVRILGGTPAVSEETFLASNSDATIVGGKVRELNGARILIVEDDNLVSSNIVQLLQSWGVVTALATDAASAKALIAESESPFDVVLCDLNLRADEENGLDVIVFAKNYYTNLVGAILITASPDVPELRDKSVPILFKPFAPNHMQRMLVAEVRRVQALE
ncbi:MAG: ATP-binding protein [Burkholderiaceae bacterium]